MSHCEYVSVLCEGQKSSARKDESTSICFIASSADVMKGDYNPSPTKASLTPVYTNPLLLKRSPVKG